MDDTISRDSVTSSTSEEFVVVHGEPKLKVPADVTDLSLEIASAAASTCSEMSEEGSSCGSSEEKSKTVVTAVAATDSATTTTASCERVIPSSQSTSVLSSASILENYPETPSEESKPGPGNEDAAHDRGRSCSLPGLLQNSEDCTVFNGVTYLGCATVNAPRSEAEIYRNMNVFNRQSKMSIPVALSVPATSEGIVRLVDPSNNTDIASFRIHRILFCARGPSDTMERQCFAFTCSHGDSPENSIFQCHVFRCDIPEAVPKILYCFGNTFRRVQKPRQLSESSSPQRAPLDFVFTVSLDFREDDGKGNYSACPKDKDVFKFKVNTEKLLQISVQQSGPQEIRIERCFGLLISPGRNVQHSDMQLIELMSMAYAQDTRQYNISGHWDPSEKCFAILNTETEKDTRVFLTVAVDLVLVGIQEPVRFTLETKAKIYATPERFWYLSRKGFTEQFNVSLKQVQAGPEPTFEVVKVESQTDKERRSHNLNLNLSGTSRAPVEAVMTPQEEAEDSEGDEPLLSGSGVVSKEVTDEDLLGTWAEVLTRWHANLSIRPKQVTQLCRKTIPEALRGEVWQLLAGCTENQDLLEAYRVLITKDSPSDAVIQRDINRTFPAHDFFKDAGGQGQDSLYRISKAYSVYDEEIGYVQGLSFLAAALLLHMPEEQAFCVLVKIMYDYQLRKLFKHGFLELHLKFYQLERLMQDQLPDLYDHFAEMGLEIHMFASQWFLTLFTAKFPLHVVFGILDLFLSEGNLTIFCVALALLKSSRKELLSHEFEGVLKYFRVHLPKKYRSEGSARELMACAVSMKVSSRKLKKYEKEYQTIQEQNLQQEDPLERYERENKRLLEDNLRLERENDDLGHELVDVKLSLNSQVDTLQDHNEELERELKGTTKLLRDTEDEKKRLEAESKSVKEMCRRELEAAETQSSRNITIIADYKQICTQLSERLEKQQTAYKEELQNVRAKVKACPDCASVFDGDKLRLSNNAKEKQEDPDVSELQKQIRELELELAQTKLALVESECKTQDLTHQLSAALAEISTASRSTWLTKTLSSIREAASNKKEPKE
ncbi:hypothetical protein RRG08_029534 [Elysia crispata]|uniref:Rab GTPase-activating protein 1 n=1 Tax=Elysia crispata TaxID=231223 RepID=A0AAE0XWB5_9GAST|nr:hypothetical protein RRG08_029534 [Elysia crispata]